MASHKITVPGEPVPQGRPRVYRTPYGVRGVDPPKSRSYKALVSWHAHQQWHGEPLDGALKVRVDVYRSIQKSGSKRQHDAKMLGTIRPTVKPDVDNYYKAVSDALTGIAWHDDNQIVAITVATYYDDGGGPRVEIEVEELS
ncbi:RusA family crossover junction endodeoxyribonuclease [Lacticaseibacillus parakribbianus]|uniref:RusA family crossover junction endodeoxyribonuclease n=1 Tax=Lacticaseibacillus parakribbianus TaxID=2970927 RepID=UPI0021CB3033|nr:RusA family crossover junction endodeoxyribonuclease [Lacticaseibacillus parakribbianus]